VWSQEVPPPHFANVIELLRIVAAVASGLLISAAIFGSLRPPMETAAALDQSSLLQAGLDHIDQGITVFDRDLELVGWNRRFIELLDFPPALVRVGARFEDFVRYNAERGEYGPGPVEHLVAERVRAAQTFVRHYFERTRPNGQIVAVQATPLASGGFVTVYTDITDRRRAESVIRQHSDELEVRVSQRTAELRAVNEELRKTEERLRLITDAIPASIAYIDQSMTVSFANRRYAELFGRTSDQVVGRSIKEILGPRLFSRLRAYLAPAFAGRSAAFDYTHTSGDGEVLITQNVLIPEVAEDAQVLGIFVLCLDITAAKKAEGALREAQKMTAIGQLAGGLAHDFNNLLTVVVGNLRSLKNEVDANLAEEYIEPAIRAGDRGVDITRRLLAFARRQPLEAIAVNVAHIVTRTADLLRGSLPSTIAITCSVEASPWSAMSDPNQLESALVNLALNARDAMPRGGTLTMGVANQTFPAGALFGDHPVTGEFVNIGVTDTGTGIDPATLSRAFEPFFTTKPFGIGSGLGLSMVYGFVKQSGGHIRIVSEVGKGTCVSFLLPRAHRIPQVDTPAQERPRSRGRGELVLLVEDNDDVGQFSTELLEDLGYTVRRVANANAALTILSKDEFTVDLVFSDVIMPGMNGVELAGVIRERYPGLPVVLTSGYSNVLAENADRGFELIQKPYSVEALSRILRKAMSERVSTR